MPRVVFVKAARERHDSTGAVKPLNTCDKCNKAIEIGSPYKHMSVKTGPRSSHKLVRCDGCPVWQVWEYSTSASARCAQIVHDARTEIEGLNEADPDAVSDVLNTAAEAARELAEEKRESAQNIEDGFGHPTERSDDLNALADDLNAWADEIDAITVPDAPDPADAECEDCGGTGETETLDSTIVCQECDGCGHAQEITEDQLDSWLGEVEDVLDPLDNAPV